MAVMFGDSDHLWNWLYFDVGDDLLIFLIWAQFWISKTSQIWGFRAFSRERMEMMACNLACWCILTTFRADYILVSISGFHLFWHNFDLTRTITFGGRYGLKFDMLTKWGGTRLGFTHIFKRTHELDHAGESLPPSELTDFRHSLLILAQIWLRVMSLIQDFRASSFTSNIRLLLPP